MCCRALTTPSTSSSSRSQSAIRSPSGAGWPHTSLLPPLSSLPSPRPASPDEWPRLSPVLARDASLRRTRRPGKQDWLVMAKAGTWSANVRIPYTGLSTRDAYRVLLEEWGARQRGSLFSRSNNIAIRLLYFSSPLYEDRADLERGRATTHLPRRRVPRPVTRVLHSQLWARPCARAWRHAWNVQSDCASRRGGRECSAKSPQSRDHGYVCAHKKSRRTHK